MPPYPAFADGKEGDFQDALNSANLMTSQWGAWLMRLATCVAAVAILAGCNPAEMHETKSVAATPGHPPNVVLLQTAADAACRCERSSPGRKDCWREFDKQVSQYQEGSGSDTACAPVSTSLRCFNEDRPDAFCVTTAFRLIGPRGRQLCSQKEAKAVEGVYNDIYDRTGEGGKAYDAALAVADRMMKGHQIAMSKTKAGCVG